MMITIAENTFAEFEKKGKKGNQQSEQNEQFDVDLVELLIDYTSSVVVSGFLGADSLKEKFKG
jgi:hypothetical protein